MTSLEEQSIAALRGNLLTGNARFMQLVWDKTVNFVKGGNDRIVFETSIRRDVVAYAMVHALFLQRLCVFGGFVRSHYSGKVWNDIDVLMVKKTATASAESHVDNIWNHMIRFVTFVLPIASRDMRIRKKRKQYAYTRTLSFGPPSDGTDISVDFVFPSEISGNIRSFVPPTVGSCLMLSDKLPYVRADLERWLGHWSLHDIVAMLKAGEDTKFSAETTTARYREFYWVRILKMERNGWTLHPCDMEPKPLSAEERKRLHVS